MPARRSAWTATTCSVRRRSACTAASRRRACSRARRPAGATSRPPATWRLSPAPAALFNAGGTYPVANTWVTLGDLLGGSGTEYLFWKGSTNPNVLPWNLVEGLVAEPSGEWVVGEDTAKGLYDVPYSCQRCHQLGSTVPRHRRVVPNPAAD